MSATRRSVQDLVSQFTDFRVRGLRARGRENLTEVLSYVEEYLADCGVNAIELGPDAPPSIRRRVASIETVVRLLDDFEDLFLIKVIGAELDFLRISEHIVRDFTRWLRGKRHSGVSTGARSG